jgi:hypothetical protein
MTKNKYARLSSYLHKFIEHNNRVKDVIGVRFATSEEINLAFMWALQLDGRLPMDGQPPQPPTTAPESTEPKKPKRKPKQKQAQVIPLH